ncbi:PREDICTED: diuretic hormone 44 [Polistes dominula]|uniref:Diuretic hormone 44 n=1 Tax=Polistes dominula TaxID=743375 RepID=A0ABM1IQE4_POLDO|nr:PREDICTED: diuretic hormone 44 [Polistes dominula]
MISITIILVTSTLITMTHCAPVGHIQKENGDLPEVLWLINQQMPELEREMYDSSNDPGPTTILRTKRIGSLSIVNNLDVLRERILLELARRKAMQDQRQIDANRLMLDKIGKRSLPVYDDYSSSSLSSSSSSSSSHPRNLENIYDWIGESGTIGVGDRHSDQERRVASNELIW